MQLLTVSLNNWKAHTLDNFIPVTLTGILIVCYDRFRSIKEGKIKSGNDKGRDCKHEPYYKKIEGTNAQMARNSRAREKEALNENKKP